MVTDPKEKISRLKTGVCLQIHMNLQKDTLLKANITTKCMVVVEPGV